MRVSSISCGRHEERAPLEVGQGPRGVAAVQARAVAEAEAEAKAEAEAEARAISVAESVISDFLD